MSAVWERHVVRFRTPEVWWLANFVAGVALVRRLPTPGGGEHYEFSSTRTWEAGEPHPTAKLLRTTSGGCRCVYRGARRGLRAAQTEALRGLDFPIDADVRLSYACRPFCGAY